MKTAAVCIATAVVAVAATAAVLLGCLALSTFLRRPVHMMEYDRSVVAVPATLSLSLDQTLAHVHQFESSKIASVTAKFDAPGGRAHHIASFLQGATASMIGKSTRPLAQHGKYHIDGHHGFTAEENSIYWLIHFDPLQLQAESPSDQFHLVQRHALLTLWYEQFETPDSEYDDGWDNTDGWLVDDNECVWYGVECMPIDFGDDIGLQAAVTGLFLSSNGLESTLPATLGLLTSLTDVVVSGNRLEGTLPSAFGAAWTNLETFDASGNFLEGTLPSEYGEWTRIVSVEVSSNILSGSFPTSLANWTEIRSLRAGYNKLTGPVPRYIAKWNRLVWLDVSSNYLSGSLSFAIEQLSSPEMLQLYNNALTGTLPDSDVNTTMTAAKGYGGNDNDDDVTFTSKLTFLELSSNMFSGSLPRAWTLSERRLANLEYLLLGDNDFTGTLDASIGRVWNNMIILDVSNNTMSGSLPENIGLWSHLERFAIADNELTGTVPSSIANWTLLVEAHFEHNGLVGTIPSGICQAETLQQLSADCVSKVQCDCCDSCS